MATIKKIGKGPYNPQKATAKGSTLKTGGPIKKAQGGKKYITQEGKNYIVTQRVNTKDGPRYYQGKSPDMSFATEIASEKARKINDSIPKVKLSPRALEVMNNKNGGSIKNKLGIMNKKKTGGAIKKAQNGTMSSVMSNISSALKDSEQLKKEKMNLEKAKTSSSSSSSKRPYSNMSTPYSTSGVNTTTVAKSGKVVKKKNGGPIKGTNAKLTLPKPTKLSAKEMKAPAKVDISKFKKAKSGAMIKRADGSMSRRGLWDNIRAAAKKNKAAGKPGKKPTAAMLQQERKIKAKTKK